MLPIARQFRSFGLMLCVLPVIGLAAAAAQSGPPPGGAAPGGPVIKDAVDPKQDTMPDRVNAVYFYGNSKVSTAVLMAGIGVVPGDVMAPAKMGKALDFVVAQYKALGLDVQVRPRVSHPKRNFVNLNFLIDEQGSGGHD